MVLQRELDNEIRHQMKVVESLIREWSQQHSLALLACYAV